MDEHDPFDLSRALEGAIETYLDPSVARFRLHAAFDPTGDQPQAIDQLVEQIESGQERCILLGVTGSGKTFTMAQIIERLNLPTLIMSHNKTLARQLYSEVSALFPENAVEYFVSHYDYYQPEAYLPKRDMYIDKELSINERAEQERFAAVASLVTRPDVVVVSSVSCIYGLNPPETFLQHHLRLHVGQEVEPQHVVKELVGRSTPARARTSSVARCVFVARSLTSGCQAVMIHCVFDSDSMASSASMWWMRSRSRCWMRWMRHGSTRRNSS